MLRFAFWNLNRKRLDDLVVDLVRQEEIDILLLAESELDPLVVTAELNKGVGGEPRMFYIAGLCPAIQVLTRFSPDFTKAIHESRRLTIRELRLPEREPLLLAAVHLPSQMSFQKSESRDVGATILAQDIHDAEAKVGHDNTVLTGDFNMNPFAPGMVMAGAIHGVMARLVADRRARIVQDRSFPFFYNPMWSLMGDISAGPSGTYYYERGEPLNYFWNTFDQVLVRPSLASRFCPDQLRIVDRIGARSLLTQRGIPDKAVASDHLPLVYAIDL